jgi:mRNA interferase RelE/StbE
VIVEWSERALAAVSRYLDDPAGLTVAIDAADALAADPEPGGSVRWGPSWRRLHVGRYRIVYAIDDELITVHRLDRVQGR